MLIDNRIAAMPAAAAETAATSIAFTARSRGEIRKREERQRIEKTTTQHHNSRHNNNDITTTDLDYKTPPSTPPHLSSSFFNNNHPPRTTSPGSPFVISAYMTTASLNIQGPHLLSPIRFQDRGPRVDTPSPVQRSTSKFRANQVPLAFYNLPQASMEVDSPADTLVPMPGSTGSSRDSSRGGVPLRASDIDDSPDAAKLSVQPIGEDEDIEEIIMEEDEDEEVLRVHVAEQDTDSGAIQQPTMSLPSPELLGLKLNWLGTSAFYIKANMHMQLRGELNPMVEYRKALTRDRDLFPYHPNIYIQLAMVDNHLGFCDVAAGNGYRALVLIQSGLGQYKRKAHPQNLGDIVRNVIGFQSSRTGESDIIINEDLQHLYPQAYKVILAGLIGCAAFYDGLKWADAALKKFPGDTQLRELQENLRLGYSERCDSLKEDSDIGQSELPHMCKTGRIYQKPYPWMQKNLFHRTADQIQEINKLNDGAAWEIRPVVFGQEHGKKSNSKKGDVGPLGVFAKRNIEGEVLMVDKTTMGVSNMPSNKGKHCDACHGVLVKPYIHSKKIIRPECCRQVSYCSQDCHNLAMAGYHKLLCQKDFLWVYERKDISKAGDCRASWRPIMFLRLMAIVLNDMERASVKKQTMHPLQHPLLSRMAANYSALAPGNFKGVTHDWQFWENIVAPTRILMELGIDIFSENEYQPEVIQTIYWRFENNANMATTSLTGSPVHMVALNPNYLFLNHSCDPNVSWHGAVPNGSVGIGWLMDREGKVLKPGSSAVWCVAGKNIKKGEELKISYIGDPQGEMGKKNAGRESKRAHLEKWFDDGCGCALCEDENTNGFQTQ